MGARRLGLSGRGRVLAGLVCGLGLALSAAAPAAAQTWRETTYTYHGTAQNGLPATATVVNPSGPNLATSFAWDSVGNLVTVTDPAGRRALGHYSGQGRLLSRYVPILAADERVTMTMICWT